MSVLQGEALPSTVTKSTSTPNAPSYYTNWMNTLATTGQNQINQATSNPSSMVAGFTPLQNAGFAALPSAASAYKPGLTAAENTANIAAKGVGASQIADFMNPYVDEVVDRMAEESRINTERNLTPALKAAFVGSGGLGAQRYANATGQALSDVERNLLNQQSGALATGYNQAVVNALANVGQLNQAAQTQGSLAAQEQNLGLNAVNAKLNAGAQQQALNQARINAPLTTASNAAALMRGYQIPVGTSSTTIAPGQQGNFAMSPLAATASLGTLLSAINTGDKAGNTPLNNFLKSVGLDKTLGEAGKSLFSSKSASSPSSSYWTGSPGGLSFNGDYTYIPREDISTYTDENGDIIYGED